MAGTGYGAASNLTGGLLSDVMQGLVPGFSGGGLLGSNPQAAPAQAAPASVVAQAPAPTPAADPSTSGQAPYTDAAQIAQLIAQNRPNRLQTLLHAWGTGQDFNSAQADLTKRNIANSLLPQQVALQQQGIAYGQSIQDPALRELYFNNPQAYAAIMQERLKPHDTAPSTITTGLGPNGDQRVDGVVLSKPSEIVGDAAGNIVQRNRAAPIPMAASTSLGDGDTGGIISTAPAAPQVVTTAPENKIGIFNPGAPQGGVPSIPAGAPPIPRGLRNNNPLNVTSLPKGQWDGQVGADGPYAQFSSVQAGLAAADKNLAAKQTLHGLNTLQGVIADPKFGWDPGNTAYVNTVAQDLGVRPDAPLNLQDPNVRARVLASMQKVELGQPSAQAPSSGQGGLQIVDPGAEPQQLTTPQDRAAHGISPADRAGYALKPDKNIVKTAEDPFGPTQQMDYTAKALSFDPLKNYITTRGFLDAAQQSMNQKGGFADLNLIDMAGKSVNPTLAMRPNMIEQFGKERGWTDEVIGKIRSTMEHGQALDDAARNALYNTIYTNTQAHYNASKGMIDKIKRDATKYGLTPQDLIPDLQEMPAAPPPAYGGNGSQQALAAARDAIRKGAPRAAVIQRLRQNGINPAGL